MKKNLLLKLIILCLSVCLIIFTCTACGGGGDADGVYTIKYNANGGIIAEEDKENDVEYGQNFTHPSVSRPGYVFNGWYLAEKKLEQGMYLYDEDITLDAHWTPIFNFDATTGEIKGFSEYASSNTIVNIPATIDGVNVQTISNNAFYNNDRITSLYVPRTVLTIGESAFDDCALLAEVKFAENSQLRTIGENAFGYCTSIKRMEFPKYLESIGNSAFYECSSLAKIFFAEGSQLETIDNGAFGNCNLIKEITLPSTVQTIGSSAFAYCTNLIAVFNGEDSALKTIGNTAFQACYALQVLQTSNTLESIGEKAFENCSVLCSIELPATVTNIGANAFSGCSAINILSASESKPTTWSQTFNPNSRPIGYGLTEITNNNWTKQVVASNRNEQIALSLSGTAITNRAAVRSVIFNGRSIPVSNVEFSSNTLFVGTKDVRTGDDVLTVGFITGGKAYVLHSEQRIIDFKIGDADEFNDFLNLVYAQPDDRLFDIDSGYETKEIHALLTANVDMGGQSISCRINSPDPDYPDTSWSCFRGSLDGQGYSVSNFGTTRQGLFWHVDTAVIKNIAFKNVVGSGGETQKAIICWQALDLTMENVYIQGKIDVINNKHVAGVCYSTSGIVFKNFLIDIEFENKRDGAPPVYAINKNLSFDSRSSNVYAISQSADGLGANKSNVGSDYGWYKTKEDLASGIKADNLALFDNAYWDISNGYPVWKVK